MGLGKSELEFHCLPLSVTPDKVFNSTEPQPLSPVTQDLIQYCHRPRVGILATVPHHGVSGHDLRVFSEPGAESRLKRGNGKRVGVGLGPVGLGPVRWCSFVRYSTSLGLGFLT